MRRAAGRRLQRGAAKGWVHRGGCGGKGRSSVAAWPRRCAIQSAILRRMRGGPSSGERGCRPPPPTPTVKPCRSMHWTDRCRLPIASRAPAPLHQPRGIGDDDGISDPQQPRCCCCCCWWRLRVAARVTTSTWCLALAHPLPPPQATHGHPRPPRHPPSVRSTNCVGMTMSTSSAPCTAVAMSPVAVRPSGHLCPLRKDRFSRPGPLMSETTCSTRRH